jgi:hypothetical protein
MLDLMSSADTSPCQASVQTSGYQVLYSFRMGGSDGWMPESALLEGGNGALYGTTPKGGTNHLETVFKLNKDRCDHTIKNTNAAMPPHDTFCAIAAETQEYM